MGYVLFDSELLSAAGITKQVVKGTTPDGGANGWHRDLVELSGNKLVALTRMMLEHGESGTVLTRTIRECTPDGNFAGVRAV
jgi:hypothetical protein